MGSGLTFHMNNGVSPEWYLLKPKTIVIPALSRDPVEAESSQLSGSRVKPGMTNLLFLLQLSA